MKIAHLTFATLAACSIPGSSVSGAPDTHCGDKVVIVDPSACAAPIADGTAAPDYGATMFNNEGDDDDCKYHVRWKASDIFKDTNVTLTLTATYKIDGTPLTAARPELEVFIGDHAAPSSKIVATEGTPGTYAIGPVRFDQAGIWTVRFHLRGDCRDSENSPHAHAAFLVGVP